MTASSFAAPARYVYYSEQKSPLETQGEPPFDGTRTKVTWSHGYLLIRYPYQKIARLMGGAHSGSLLTFKISVGNEMAQPVFFTVGNAEVFYQGKALALATKFYNEKAHEAQEGMELLRKTEFRSDPQLHGDLIFDVMDWKESYEDLELKLEVTVLYEGKKETLHPILTLHRGYYISE